MNFALNVYLVLAIIIIISDTPQTLVGFNIFMALENLKQREKKNPIWFYNFNSFSAFFHVTKLTMGQAFSLLCEKKRFAVRLYLLSGS